MISGLLCLYGFFDVSEQYAADVQHEQDLGQNSIDFIGSRSMLKPLGGYEKLDRILSRTAIDEAIIALESEAYGKIRNMIGACDKKGVIY